MNDYDIRQLGFSPEKFKKIEQYIQACVESKRAPGLVLCLARDNEEILYRSSGFSSIERQQPCTPQTLYRIASLTKPVISTALMLLVEKGLCSEDDLVEKWLAQVNDMQVLNASGEREAVNVKMSLRHLLTHTSGLCYDFNAPESLKSEYVRSRLHDGCENTGDFANNLLQLPLAFQPGQGYHYGFSTDLLGHIIELISGQTLDVHLQENIFTPLGMTHTGFSIEEAPELNVASMYAASSVDDDDDNRSYSLKHIEGYSSNAVFNAPTVFSAGGGLLSTPEDYMKFLKMLMSGGFNNDDVFLSEQSIDRMTQNYLAPTAMPYNIGLGIAYDTEGYGFGYNVKVLMNPRTKDYVVSEGEYGWAGSTNTYAWVDPRRDLAVAIFSQYVPFACYPLEQELKKLIYDAMTY